LLRPAGPEGVTHQDVHLQCRHSQLRERVARDVIATANSVDERVFVGGGSWLAGDFHLRAHPFTSYSDIDLAARASASGDYSSMCRAVADAVQERLGLELPVTVPAPEWTTLDVPGARFLAIGEFLRQIPYVKAHSPRTDYLLAKISLSVSRMVREERYAEVADRLNRPAARHALAVKTGQLTRFDVGAALALLAEAGTPEAEQFAATCVARTPSRATYVQYLNDLMDRTDLPAPVATRMSYLVGGALRLCAGDDEMLAQNSSSVPLGPK
jgi:hypothetical protein